MLGHIDTSLIDWSRAQFALTAIYHWIFVPLTLGLEMCIRDSLYPCPNRRGDNPEQFADFSLGHGGCAYIARQGDIALPVHQMCIRDRLSPCCASAAFPVFLGCGLPAWSVSLSLIHI